VVVITNSHENLHLVNWPTPKVLAFSTTRFLPKDKNSKNHFNLINKSATYSGEHPSEFDYFNLATHVGDCAISVEHNRSVLLNHLPNGCKIQWLEQVHGNHVVYVGEHNIKPMVADAAITREKKVALAIMTADCLPILLADKNGNEIAAIHAGWRPLAAGIIKATLRKMKTPSRDVVAWFGPCIGKEAFEVGKEVKEQFIDSSREFLAAFTTLPSDNRAECSIKFLADLTMIARLQLAELGVEKILTANACTFTQSKQYYSYRREGKTGRMASIISLV
jgi:YfiH family protein